MKSIINNLLEHQTLTRSEAKEVLSGIAKNQYNQSQLISFLTIYMMRKITVAELEGFRDALLEVCVPVRLDGYDTIDLCGTGGDGKNTFNISTLAAFVVAGTGAKVAKHGNYGVSSICGSSNVLEHLGIKFTEEQSKLERQIEETNICFLHAPLFHPALKNVAAVRKELGVKTFFNMLGPLVNPARPNKQVTGVFSLELARLYSYLFQQSEKKYAIVFSLDAYDEVSLTDRFKVIGRTGEDLYAPEDLGFRQQSASSLFGGETVAEAADIFTKILTGQGSAEQNNVVVANAAIALRCHDETRSLDESLLLARESLHSGKALKSFQTLLNLN